MNDKPDIYALKNIPTIQQVVDAADVLVKQADLVGYKHTLEDPTKHEPAFVQVSKIILSLIKQDEKAANEVMDNQGWKPADEVFGDGENSKSLIELSCYDNHRGQHPIIDILLYNFFCKRDPECINSKSKLGGTMLHAWAEEGGHQLVIFQDLLEKGVNPLATDKFGRTVMGVLDESMQGRSEDDDMRQHFEAAKEMVRAKIDAVGHTISDDQTKGGSWESKTSGRVAPDEDGRIF